MRSPDLGMVGGRSDLATVIDNLALAMDNIALSSPGMAQGSTTNTSFKAANTTTYRCGGLILSKATFEVAGTAGNGTFTGAQDVTPNANSVQERVYVVCLDASGNPSVIAGAQATGSGNAPYPDITNAAPAAAGGPEGLALATNSTGDEFPTGYSTTSFPAYPAGVTATPLGLRNNKLTPIGGCRIAVAAGATGFEMGTTQPATSGAITATYFNGYPTPQILTAQ